MPRPISEEGRLRWKALIEKQRQSGLSMRKWCLENNVHPHTFCYWKAKLFPKQLQKSSFIELKPKGRGAISLKAHGFSIRLESGCDPQVRRQLLAFVGKLAC